MNILRKFKSEKIWLWPQYTLIQFNSKVTILKYLKQKWTFSNIHTECIEANGNKTQTKYSYTYILYINIVLKGNGTALENSQPVQSYF